MASLGQYALPGIIVLSALGAVIMCLLVFRYGFTTVSEEAPEEAAHRLFVTRFGHALVGVCFAAAAMLAVVASSVHMRAARLPASTVANAADAETVRRLQERFDRRLAELEHRLTEVAASVPNAGPRTEPPALPRRAPAKPPARLAPATEEDVSALPAEVGTRHRRATIQGIGVDVLSGAVRGGQTVYAVRLADLAGRPLGAATVSVVRQMADGSTVRVPLTAAGEVGLYRGRVAMTAGGPSDPRLSVVAANRRFELSLAHGVSW